MPAPTSGEGQLASVAVSILALLVPLLVVVLWRWKQLISSDERERDEGGSEQGYEERDYLCHGDLVDPAVRGDHIAFNAHLHRRFAGQQFVPVRGEDGCFVALAYATCKEVMNDHASFSSNPFAEDRLVALNTMSKADHSRVLRLVHSHYTQESIEQLDERVSAVIERCTDDLEANADVTNWAKRIHMASTLARLGVKWEAWGLVDEIVVLNDAMVALVAPLGGVGPKYSTLPPWQILRVLLGLVCSLGPTLAMAWRLGPRCTWEIIRPDQTVLFPAARPRMGLWWRPELLSLVPKYFLLLHRLLVEEPVEEGPLLGMRKGLGEGTLQLAEALTLLVQLMVNMTSANALQSMVSRLASETEAFAAARADPEALAPAFVQEVLRLDAPLQRNPRRVLKQPTRGKLAGAPLKEGDTVLVFLGAANMDPAVFEKPEEFRLDRVAEGPHTVPLSFGSGMHYCLGSSLVKMEMRMALRCLLGRFASAEVVDQERLTDVDVGNWGFTRLRVKLARA